MSAADTAAVLAAILKAHPTLSWRGWWSRWYDRNDPPGTLERVRRESLNERGLVQFGRAMAFLEVAPRIKSLNGECATYTNLSQRAWPTGVRR